MPICHAILGICLEHRNKEMSPQIWPYLAALLLDAIGGPCDLNGLPR
jgi:hypothetical protein